MEEIYLAEKKKRKKKSEYSDDCGAWNSASGAIPKSFYVVNGDDLTRVDYLKKEYGHFKTVNKKRQFIPLVPQPSPDSILELHRNYSTLKLESTYKRRVSYFGKIPSSLTNIIPIAVVEYTGKFPGRAPHRKSTKLTQDYIRTPANVMEKIGNLTQGNQQPRLIYNKLILESDSVRWTQKPEANLQ